MVNCYNFFNHIQLNFPYFLLNILFNRLSLHQKWLGKIPNNKKQATNELIFFLDVTNYSNVTEYGMQWHLG